MSGLFCLGVLLAGCPNYELGGPNDTDAGPDIAPPAADGGDVMADAGEGATDAGVVCAYACCADLDCPDGWVCLAHECVPPSDCEFECCADSDCPEGEICEDGRCICDGDPPDSDPCKTGKTLLCHYPPGQTSEPHAICVGDSAVPAHEAHGDTLGDCP